MVEFLKGYDLAFVFIYFFFPKPYYTTQIPVNYTSVKHMNGVFWTNATTRSVSVGTSVHVHKGTNGSVGLMGNHIQAGATWNSGPAKTQHHFYNPPTQGNAIQVIN